MIRKENLRVLHRFSFCRTEWTMMSPLGLESTEEVEDLSESVRCLKDIQVIMPEAVEYMNLNTRG